ncbi:MAG: hypothetical protein DMG30_25715 [Acidobacteria bacterium]|nr:MAG: hypothetical protein DMG30_25715 [Acidobacteriota bacterium]
MQISQKIALAILALATVFAPARAYDRGTSPAPRQLAVKAAPEKPESPKRPTEPASLVIEQVQATDVDQHVQVRITGSGVLSCTPSPMGHPDRLVLDCAGVHFQTQQGPIRVDLDPVRSVHVSQFKADVVRVVIDLVEQSPYTIRADGNTVTVVFNSMRRQPSSLESTSTQVEPPTRPAEGGEGDQALGVVTVVPDNLPQSLKATSPALARGEASLAVQSAPAPLAPQSPAVVSGDLPKVQEAASEASTPAERLDSALADQDYVIGPQDLLAINVWHEPELSQSVPVRPDGKISLPLLGDLKASGLTPRLLQNLLAKELEAYIRKPQVTVIVREINSQKFYVIGEVGKPGEYSLATSMTVLDALAAAGGFRDFAKAQKIYLLRMMPDGSRKRLPFDYKSAVNGKNSYHDIELQSGDTLVVP